jgi:hypothetical protein
MSNLTYVNKHNNPITHRSSFLLRELLHMLDDQGYDFVPPTPASHARVVARPDRHFAEDLPGVYGWSLPFDPQKLAVPYVDELIDAGILKPEADGLLRSTVRVARLNGKLFIHSAYPTSDVNSVFLGPDSYRFADFIVANMPGAAADLRIADYGTGAGVGGIVAASHVNARSVTLADINPDALALASVNAQFAGLEPETDKIGSPSELTGAFDVIVTHPPFMIDEDRRAYRDGGGLYGAQLSRDWVIDALPKLAPAGKLIMHTGAPIVRGTDVLLAALRDAMPVVGFRLEYRELDPDIFGDELDKPACADVDRIAAVGAVVTRVRP